METSNEMLYHHQINDSQKYTVFIGCLPGRANQEDLIKKYGNIFDIKITRKGGKKGSGYGSFSTPSKPLYEHLISTPQKIDGRVITCRPYLQGDAKIRYLQRLNKRRIFIRGLDLKWTDGKIFEFFSQLWEVEKAYAIRDLNGASRGYGYVNFFRPKDAKNALNRGFLDFEGVHVKCTPFQKQPGHESGADKVGNTKVDRRKKSKLKKKTNLKKKPNLDFKHRGPSKVTGIARARRGRLLLQKNHKFCNLRMNLPQHHISSEDTILL